MTCELCTDPDGVPCFPLYGIGPHTHREGPIIGSTELAEQQAPGFTPDPECPGMGVWWCPHCSSGKPVDPDPLAELARISKEMGEEL